MSTYRFIDGEGDLPFAKIENQFATAEISFYGAHVTSFIPQGEKPVLWVSRQSMYQYGKAIRGGIPVCWPWFGAHPSDRNQPSHGYARIMAWPLVEALDLPDGATQLSFELSPEALKQRVAVPDFQAKMTVTVGRELEVKLYIRNLGPEAWSYTGALHTYFNVSDIRKVSVCGLDGAAYRDSLTGEDKVQQGDITFAGEVDRIYRDTTGACDIVDAGWNRTIRVAKRGSASTVVWNPWIEKSQKMSDFGDDEYLGMLCVETANAGNDVRRLAPGADAELTTIIGIA